MTSPTAAFEHRMLAPQKRYTPPPGAREILLVRHGSVNNDNPEIIELEGLRISDPPLLPAGHEQAALLAARLRHEPLAAIFTSPLQRTKQTAAPLAEITGITPRVINQLREAFLGEMEFDFHKRAATGDPLLKKMLAEEDFGVIPNAEKMPAFGARLRDAINTITALIEPGAIAVAVVHAGVIAELCRQATGSRPFGFFAPDNTSITRLVVNQDGSLLLRGFNDSSHLSGAIFSTPQ
jgi:probable phosphoglycerate mutase